MFQCVLLWYFAASSFCFHFVLLLSLNPGMSPLQDSIFWDTSCRHRDGKGTGISTPEAPVGLTGPHLQNPAPQQEPSSLSHTAPNSLRAVQSHSCNLQHHVPGFPQHGPVA